MREREKEREREREILYNKAAIIAPAFFASFQCGKQTTAKNFRSTHTYYAHGKQTLVKLLSILVKNK